LQSLLPVRHDVLRCSTPPLTLTWLGENQAMKLFGGFDEPA
jgi:hypothetical protein